MVKAIQTTEVAPSWSWSVDRTYERLFGVSLSRSLTSPTYAGTSFDPSVPGHGRRPRFSWSVLCAIPSTAEGRAAAMANGTHAAFLFD